jgi:hypothetical protein
MKDSLFTTIRTNFIKLLCGSNFKGWYLLTFKEQQQKSVITTKVDFQHT